MQILLKFSVFALLLLCSTMVRAQVIERVSVDVDGNDADSFSEAPAVNENGQFVVFGSAATDLVSGDGNARVDVFIRDRNDNSTTLLSRDLNGLDSNDHSSSPKINHNGQFIVFISTASDLVSGDTNANFDIFLHDLQAGTNSRMSISSDGLEADGDSFGPSISGDGRWATFLSGATNLLGLGIDTNGLSDIFLRDTQTSLTTRVSVDSNGNQGSGGVGNTMDPHLSVDGRYIAFASDMTDLVEGDANGNTDIFLHDQQSNETSLVSIASDGTQGTSNAEDLALSSNGRFVVFRSGSDAMLPAGMDTNASVDIFIRDTENNITDRVSVSSDGLEADGDSFGPSVSGDGRFVAFESNAQNLLGAGNDTNIQRDIFVHDRLTGETVRVNTHADGTQANGGSESAMISDDGHLIVFQSDASNLVDDDSNGATDIFIASNPLRPPFIGAVNDGEADDIDIQSSTTTISANWPEFRAAASVITNFEWAIGTSSGAINIQGFTDVGTDTNASNNTLSLTEGESYFVSVRAIDDNGNISDVSVSDGVTVDTSVVNGTGSGSGGNSSGGCSLLR